MDVIIVTGSAGLIGSEAVLYFHDKGFHVVGMDNDMRRVYFGDDASTEWNLRRLMDACPRYTHHAVDIRDMEKLEPVFREYSSDIKFVLHAAAQPSHDWAAREPLTDFSVNATGTLNLLELTRRHAHGAAFLFMSTNKVYGDNPNRLPLVEGETRWEVDSSHLFAAEGIDETMSVDDCLHSLFGVSKLAADALVQEYGRYFGMKTACFRCGCLTGGKHSGTELHGFLAYLGKCAITGDRYSIFGYKGKQVRDNIHSADLVSALGAYCANPRQGEIYNMGGSRFSNCSMLEAVDKCEALVGKKMNTVYKDQNRMGDHIWYISDVRKFQNHYPDWKYQHTMDDMLQEIITETDRRL